MYEKDYKQGRQERKIDIDTKSTDHRQINGGNIAAGTDTDGLQEE